MSREGRFLAKTRTVQKRAEERGGRECYGTASAQHSLKQGDPQVHSESSHLPECSFVRPNAGHPKTLGYFMHGRLRSALTFDFLHETICPVHEEYNPCLSCVLDGAEIHFLLSLRFEAGDFFRSFSEKSY